MTFEFSEWPKIARLNRDIIITEKIDGTNAAIQFDEFGDWTAQSRKRLISPEDDNFGFANWVHDNHEDLFYVLGPGIHFGEWWGSGIQRGYGLPKGEKRFSLFNTTRWADADLHGSVPGLEMVPVLYAGPFRTIAVQSALGDLKVNGSEAAPGFDKPEGIVIFHTAANLCFKVTLEKDELPKALAG